MECGDLSPLCGGSGLVHAVRSANANIEHRTSNIEHRTLNIERRKRVPGARGVRSANANIEHRTKKMSALRAGSAGACPMERGAAKAQATVRAIAPSPLVAKATRLEGGDESPQSK